MALANFKSGNFKFSKEAARVYGVLVVPLVIKVVSPMNVNPLAGRLSCPY